MTKICIPTASSGGWDDIVGEHFGRVPTFTICDADSEHLEIVENTSEHMGGTGLPGELLASRGVDVVLCQGLGRRAVSLLSDAGISVCTGVTGRVRDVLDQWRAGQYSGSQDVEPCTRHEFHTDHE